MASSTSSGTMSSLVQSSGSEEDHLQALMDQRKRKRMISNRESARRSRMRKQKLLDDLTAQVSHLRKENHHMVTRVSVTAQHLMGVEAENCVLRAQVGELTHRLESLDEIIHFLNANSGFNGFGPGFTEPVDGMLMNHMNYLNHPIMASVDSAFQC